VGSDNLKKELDLIAIVDALRKVDTITDFLFNKHQITLLENVPINHINWKDPIHSSYPKDANSKNENITISDELEDMINSYSFEPDDPTTKKLLNKIFGNSGILMSEDIWNRPLDISLYNQTLKSSMSAKEPQMKD